MSLIPGVRLVCLVTAIVCHTSSAAMPTVRHLTLPKIGATRGAMFCLPTRVLFRRKKPGTGR